MIYQVITKVSKDYDSWGLESNLVETDEGKEVEIVRMAILNGEKVVAVNPIDLLFDGAIGGGFESIYELSKDKEEVEKRMRKLRGL